MSFKVLLKKTLLFVRYPAILALRAPKRQTLLPSPHWICLVPRLMYPIMILNIVSVYSDSSPHFGGVHPTLIVIFLKGTEFYSNF